MDEAGYEIFKEKIRQIISGVNNLIKENNVKLDEYDVKLKDETKQLQYNKETKYKELDGKINQAQKYIQDIEDKKENLNSDRKVYEEVLIQLNNEIEDLKFKIDNQTSTVAVFLDVFNHLYNPIGAVESDKVIELTDTLNDLIKKATENEVEVRKRVGQISRLDDKQSHLDMALLGFNNEKAHLIKSIDDKQIEIEKIGNLKREAESQVKTLEVFLQECNLLFEKCETFGPASMEEISQELNILYHSYNLNI
ncbi:hypothetical protein DICPUDRAFT_148648 [Dictyostelium purpureum]|uniref:Uncharacterized protein n=1 Tax=Dictyostelium purpureum TaxID=5786 RepID=F0ZBM7_DICPU|nr:uncharacterized protein DICPUDRAFT_148648 [Dictyostelium purpureum]EGC38648.1 hypothetical protein DICPUDRAFT_148648 [Dictyostelium purpureum]|eukprot:XP_003284841.1 hypothetical protein DICPUDRAFT_148648 [Dictyostelium purpureum]